jgi:hypothetical protein
MQTNQPDQTTNFVFMNRRLLSGWHVYRRVRNYNVSCISYKLAATFQIPSFWKPLFRRGVYHENSVQCGYTIMESLMLFWLWPASVTTELSRIRLQVKRLVHQKKKHISVYFLQPYQLVSSMWQAFQDGMTCVAVRMSAITSAFRASVRWSDASDASTLVVG